jgi:hypothetical protein
MIMRGIAGYLLIGMFAALASAALTLMELGLEASARPAPKIGPVIQHVDRTHKGDRLDAHTTIDKGAVPKKRNNRVLIGCDPAFSALSSSIHSNFSGRCVA